MARYIARRMLPSFGEQTLDISEADTESVVEPDGMTDDFA